MNKQPFDQLGLMTERKIASRKRWKQTPVEGRIYSQGTPVYPVQIELQLEFRTRDNNGLPIHSSNLEQKNNQQIESEIVEESHKHNDHNSYYPPLRREGKFKETIYSGDKKQINELLKKRGINPYEWEPFLPKQDPPTLVSSSWIKEYYDYRKNVKKLFPEYYQGYA
jgi:hypothetical protein